jgi:hypothetical protein
MIEDLKSSINKPTVKDNYLKIGDMIRADKFLGFFVTYNNGEFSGCSGVMTPSIWKKNYARINTRFYLFTKFREVSLVNFQRSASDRKNFTKTLYSNEVNLCMDLNLDVIFVTRENKGRHNAIETICRRRNLITPNANWIVAKDYIQTCDNISRSCIQRCKYKVLNRDFDLNKIRQDFKWMSQDEYDTI